ncbi:MAG: NUDIX domain-containing protein [Acidimicrobiia bacterium]|nr:NUDIX domain-containing protein [Acidimicrobiia bacterium]
MVTDEFSVHSVPISPASTVLLLDDRPELHVLMVKRTSRVAFAPDAWVFPGGRVDPGDHEPRLWSACDHLDDDAASDRLELGAGGLAWWVAVVRETLEEAGVLLGSADGADIAQLAGRLRQDERCFADLVDEHNIRFDCSLIQEVAQFVTPLGPPRRFDARFFVARMPEEQEAAHDDGEVVDTRWVQAGDALERFERGDFNMISPTVRMLDSLAAFDSVEQVMDVAAERREYLTIRVRDHENEYRALLPGDQGYETARSDIEKGRIRLYL